MADVFAAVRLIHSARHWPGPSVPTSSPVSAVVGAAHPVTPDGATVSEVVTAACAVVESTAEAARGSSAITTDAPPATCPSHTFTAPAVSDAEMFTTKMHR